MNPFAGYQVVPECFIFGPFIFMYILGSKNFLQFTVFTNTVKSVTFEILISSQNFPVIFFSTSH